MPPAGIIAAAALIAIGYTAVKPIGHGINHAGRAIAHTVGKVTPHKHKSTGGADEPKK